MALSSAATRSSSFSIGVPPLIEGDVERHPAAEEDAGPGPAGGTAAGGRGGAGLLGKVLGRRRCRFLGVVFRIWQIQPLGGQFLYRFLLIRPQELPRRGSMAPA